MTVSLSTARMKMTKKSLSTKNQAQLKIVCDHICDNIYDLLDTFGIEYKPGGKAISMSCPVHGGDNRSAVNIYPEGERYRGNWKCRTHSCEQTFKSSVLGFIRGILSHQKYGWSKEGDQTCTFDEAVEFSLKFINKDLKSIKVSKSQKDKATFTSAVSYISDSQDTKQVSYPNRSQVRTSLEMPAQYYIDRGYSKEILDKYDIGLCTKPDKEMYNRVVVPIYDNDYINMIGCSGRSIFEKCSLCSSYHNPDHQCPSDEKKWLFPKWKHSLNFKSQNSLYNFWFSKEHIKQTYTVVIVESPGNVWKLEENNIHNSVAIFGSSLSDRQKIILDSSGAMNIIVLTDNDDAGKKAAEQIKQKCQNTYRIFIPQISKSDVGEMNSEEIDTQIKKYIENII